MRMHVCLYAFIHKYLCTHKYVCMYMQLENVELRKFDIQEFHK